MEHQPFLVQIGLRTPVLKGSGSFLTLDAILAAVLFREYGDVERAHQEIPLAQTAGVWHGSAMFSLGDSGRFGYSFTAALKPSLADRDFPGPWAPPLRELPGRYDTARGDTKYTSETWRGSESERVLFFGCGDLWRVDELLRSLTGIGKKTAQGFGEIASINMTPLAIDFSLCLPDGSPARPIPALLWPDMEGAESPSIDMATWFPPYWKDEHSCLCAVPSRDFFRDEDRRELVDLSPEDMATFTLETAASPAGDQKYCSGIDFFYRHIGADLTRVSQRNILPAPAGSSCQACDAEEPLFKAGNGGFYCGRCLPLCGTIHQFTPGRFAKGNGLLCSPSFTRMALPATPGTKLYPSLPDVEILTIGKGSNIGKSDSRRLRTELLLHPPTPPFLYFESANGSGWTRNLRVTWSLDRTWLCGAENKVVSLPRIQSGYRICKELGIKKDQIDTEKECGGSLAHLSLSHEETGLVRSLLSQED